MKSLISPLVFSFFITLNLMMAIGSLVSMNFFLVWIFMEVSLISFVGMILYSESNKKQGSFGSVIYFSANIVTSILILILFLISNFNFISLNLMEIYILVKLAISPYYYYMLSISGRISMFMLYWVLTVQKVIPFILLWELPVDGVSILMGLSISIWDCLSVGVGKIKTLIVWSSFSGNWLILTIDCVSFTVGFEYLIVFWACLTGLVLLLFSELNSNTFSDRFIKYFILVNSMGFPPTSMFLVKMMIIANLLEQNLLLLCLFLLGGQVAIVKILMYFFKMDLMSSKLNFSFNTKFI